jgi:hypothetical protein
MKIFRLIEIYFKDSSQLQSIYNWEWLHRNEIVSKNLRIIYIHHSKFMMVLYGFDGSEKWQTKSIQDLNSILPLIQAMPMGSLTSNKKFDNYYFCGLPQTPATSHCFQDETHRTCCMLGKEAREYADKSGNPIGRASIEAFKQYYGFYPTPNTLTPWCTCIGSKVCSFYSKKFNDGTHVKFIDRVHGGIILSSSEDKYKTLTHNTPGVSN